MGRRNLRYREALPDGRESSDFLICPCCGVRVTGAAVDDESDTIRRTTVNLTLQRSEREYVWRDDQLTRERDRAWHNDRWTRERVHACNEASSSSSSSSYQMPPHLPPPSHDEYRTDPRRSNI